MHRASVILALAVAPLAAQQTVVVAPPPNPNPELSISDPYGPCLPDPRRTTGGVGGCIPNPYYRPDVTVGVYNPTAIYKQQAASQENGGVRAALNELQLELMKLEAARAADTARLLGEAAQRERSRAALASVLRAQHDLASQYRAAWPAWSDHWRSVQPTIVTALDTLEKEAEAGKAEHGCGYFLGFTGGLKVAVPPAPDQNLEAFRASVYNLREQCVAATKSAPTITAAIDAVRSELRGVSEWARGRSDYYASLPATP